ncbi:MAG: extracellular solute-binding protein [Treponema sp.]|jgi:multiple sugar transport system substrate-binding protein|nr:extracellular solute-binding protein [Treponema sp.]
MAVKPADRLFFITALAVLGIALLFRLRPGKLPENLQAPESLRLTVKTADGLGAEEIGILISGYAPESPDIDPGIIEEGEADILITEGRLLAEEIAAGRYLPLDKFQRPGPPEERWALPLVSSMDVLIYNIPLLRAAGFDRPPRTRSEFLSYARRLKKEPSSSPSSPPFPFALGLGPGDDRAVRRDIFSWFRSGGLPLAEDGKPQFGGSRYTETLEFFSLLNSEGVLAPGSFARTGAERVEEFIQGGLAMMVVSSRELRRIREKMGNEHIGITLVPQADDYTGKPVLGLSTWYAGIRADSPHPNEAWALLNHLKGRSVLLAEAEVLVPGTGAYEPYISLDPLLDKAWDMYEAADMAEEFLGIPGTGELEAVLRRELEALFHRDSPKSPEEAAAAIRQAWEQWKNPENLW